MNTRRKKTTISNKESKVILGPRVRGLMKQSLFRRGDAWYGALIDDIKDPNTSLVAVCESLKVLDQMITQNCQKFNKYLLNQSYGTGSVNIYSKYHNKNTHLEVHAKHGVHSVCGYIGRFEEEIPIYAKYLPSTEYKGDDIGYGRAMKHLVFSNRTYRGDEIIKALLKDITRPPSKANYVKTSVDTLVKRVIRGAITDDSTYFVKFTPNNGLRIILIEQGKEPKKSHLHKSVAQLVEEYKNVETHNSASTREEA